MDLASAKKEAATRSLASKKKVFINLLKSGEHELADKASDQPMVLYDSGKEVPLPTPKVKPAPQPVVSKKKEAVKKVVEEAKVKKVVSKKPKEKVMKKVSKVSAHKGVNRVAAPKGKSVTMTAKQLRAKVLEGKSVFNTKGNEIPCTAMANRDPGKKLNVVTNSKGFFITK